MSVPNTELASAVQAEIAELQRLRGEELSGLVRRMDDVFSGTTHTTAAPGMPLNSAAQAPSVQAAGGGVKKESKRPNEAKPKKTKGGDGSEPSDPPAPAPVASAGNQAPLPLSPAHPPPSISPSATSAPAPATTPPPHAAARPEHTLPRTLVQRSDPKWQPDDSRDNCAFCRKEFTWLSRRHHCRCSSSHAALEFSCD